MKTLAEPIPLPIPKPFRRWEHDETDRILLDRPEPNVAANLFDVLARRRTRREFGPLSFQSLSSILWHTAKAHRVVLRDLSVPLVLTPLPSAGGCRSVEIIVVRPQDGIVAQYDGHGHSLIRLGGVEAMVPVIVEVDKVMAHGDGTIMIFAADSEKLKSRYAHCESLAWRDSGVLLGGLAMVSEALGLAFCPLGINCQKLVESVLGNERFLESAVV